MGVIEIKPIIQLEAVSLAWLLSIRLRQFEQEKRKGFVFLVFHFELHNVSNSANAP
jgi:hypothetical protein